MQDYEYIEMTQEGDIPSWKPIDDALRAMTTLRLHREEQENYAKLKESY